MEGEREGQTRVKKAKLPRTEGGARQREREVEAAPGRADAVAMRTETDTQQQRRGETERKREREEREREREREEEGEEKEGVNCFAEGRVTKREGIDAGPAPFRSDTEGGAGSVQKRAHVTRCVCVRGEKRSEGEDGGRSREWVQRLQ